MPHQGKCPGPSGPSYDSGFANLANRVDLTPKACPLGALGGFGTQRVKKPQFALAPRLHRGNVDQSALRGRKHTHTRGLGSKENDWKRLPSRPPRAASHTPGKAAAAAAARKIHPAKLCVQGLGKEEGQGGGRRARASRQEARSHRLVTARLGAHGCAGEREGRRRPSSAGSRGLGAAAPTPTPACARRDSPGLSQRRSTCQFKGRTETAS